MNTPIPFYNRITCTIPEACAATGLGRTKLYDLIKSRRLLTSKIGSRRLIQVSSLLAVLAAPSNEGVRR
jgi:excisionase family DNA binding protein